MAGGWWWDLRCRLRPPLASCSRPVGGSGGGAGTWGQGREAGTLSSILISFNFPPISHLVLSEVTFSFLQVVIIISAFIHETKILGTSTNNNISRKHSPESIHHVPTPNVPLARGGPYPTVFPNIIEVFHCRRIRCLSFMINCLSFIVLYVFHSRE